MRADGRSCCALRPSVARSRAGRKLARQPRQGGSPGTSDSQTYAEWAALHGVSDPLADDENDGLSNVLEYAFGGTPTAMDAARLPVMSVENHTVNGLTDA